MDVQPSTGARQSARAGQRSFGLVSLALVALLFVLIGLAAALSFGGAGRTAPEVTLPILAIVGILALLDALALVSIAFAAFGLDDNTKALALPEGSVRAVIALSLVVLFAVLSIFLFASLSQENAVVSGLTAAQQKDFVGKLATDQQSQVVSRATGATSGSSPEPTYTVYYRNSASQPSQDFAKQLLVLIGTLVTSVAGFYFGAQTAASAARAKNASRTPQNPNEGGANAGSGSPAGVDTPTATTGPTSEADALKALGAVKLTPGSGGLPVTPEAARLGHDPTLASEASAENQNKGVVY
ncbi:MAG TPA: hypothetical protein VGC72_02850 [Candidatus Elarobacter sp.]|jgi:hypothetical protein